MTSHKIGFTLNGDVGLQEFSEALVKFTNLAKSVLNDIKSDKNVTWQISDLDFGSATVEAEAIAEFEDFAVKAVIGYQNAIASVKFQKRTNVSKTTYKYANELVSVNSETIPSVDCFTSGDFIEEFPLQKIELAPDKTIEVLGIVKGIVETLSSRQKLRFIVYDEIFDKAVKCTFTNEQKDMVRGIWDKKVVVTGIIIRDAKTNRPYEVKEISNIKIIDTQFTGSLRKARGIIPWTQDMEPSELRIRRVRDE